MAMNGALIEVSGNWGHFKKPETNNNPLSHDFITKTSLIGMIGAVLGKERDEMSGLFPQLSDDLRYGVCIRGAIRKVSWAFTMRRARDPLYQAPKQMEFLKNPHYTVAIALHNERSVGLLDDFIKAVSNSEARFTPVLGLHNCPAGLWLEATGNFQPGSGEFTTQGFITGKHIVKAGQTGHFRLGVDRIPTYQDDDFWNPPDKYEKVIYPSEGRSVTAEGDYFIFSNQSQWVLI